MRARGGVGQCRLVWEGDWVERWGGVCTWDWRGSWGLWGLVGGVEGVFVLGGRLVVRGGEGGVRQVRSSGGGFWGCWWSLVGVWRWVVRVGKGYSHGGIVGDFSFMKLEMVGMDYWMFFTHLLILLSYSVYPPHRPGLDSNHHGQSHPLTPKKKISFSQGSPASALLDVKLCF